MLSYCKKITRGIWLLAAIGSCSALIALGIWKFVGVNWVRSQIETTLKSDTFSALKVGSFDYSWTGLSLGVTLYDVQAMNFSAKTLQGDMSLLAWLFSQDLVLNSVRVDRAELVLGIDTEKEAVEVLALSGEKLSKTLHSKTNLALEELQHLDKIEINQLSIQWLSPLGRSEQEVSGTWAWRNKEHKAWKFKGTHALHLSKNLPVFKQSIAIQGTGFFQELKWSLAGTSQETALSGNWRTLPGDADRWDIDIRHMPLEPLHAVLGALKQSAAVSKIPGWLSWLDQSLGKGLITYLYWDNSDKPTGEIHFEETDLQYHADWPALTAIAGKWQYADRAWRLSVSEAMIQADPVTALRADGQMKNADLYVVTVDGRIVSTVESGVDFLKACPLRRTVGEKLYKNNLQGEMDLALHLDIPIKIPAPHQTEDLTPPQITVKGGIGVKHLAFKNDDWDVQGSQGHGAMQFTEKGMTSTLDNVSLIVPVTWPVVDWPESGRLDFTLDWSALTENSVLFSGRFDDAWDAKIKWIDAVPINGEIIINPQKNQQSNWASLQDKTLLIAAPYIEARLQLEPLTKSNASEAIDLQFSFLKFPLSDVRFPQEHKRLSGNRPIHVTSQSTWFGHYFLGKVDVQLNPEPEAWNISQITIERPNFELNAAGRWLFGQEPKLDLIILSGNMSSRHIGNLLNDWKAGGTNLKEGRMESDFSVQWSGRPMDFAWDKLSGDVGIRIRNGRILGVDVGLGRLLGLLSVDNLKRRLQLDFRDVFKKGFVFDEAQARLTLAGNIWLLKWATVKAPVADLTIKGSTNVKTGDLSLSIQAVPKSATSGVPIAAAIAGGPALGAGLWVFDKVFMGGDNKKSSSIFYEVTGTLDKPSVNRVRNAK
jgi:uncharacterized protein YhdP